MSQERRERQKERQASNTRGRSKRIFVYAALIALALGVAYFLNHRNEHKHDGFARCLGDRGVKMYGAYWCPHCQDQKEKFGASFKSVPYVECGVEGDTHAQSQACKEANVKHYPTWQFPPMGERVERVFSLEELADRTGCTLP
jgi:glutaredoxin